MKRSDESYSRSPSHWILLSSVCVLAWASADHAYARNRLRPAQPSVQVYSEALEALRRSTQPIGGYGVMMPRAGIPFGEPTPGAPPQRRAYQPPAPPRAADSAPRPADAPAKRPAPAKPKPAPKEASAPKPLPVPESRPVPAPLPAPEMPEPSEISAPEAVPVPVPESVPSQPPQKQFEEMLEPAPEPIAAPAPAPAAPTPEPIPEPEPVPAPASPEALPDPDFEAMEFEPFPEIAPPNAETPAASVAPASDSTPPAAETTPEPVPEPISEALPKSSAKPEPEPEPEPAPIAEALPEPVPAPEPLPAVSAPATDISEGSPQILDAAPIPDVAQPEAAPAADIPPIDAVTEPTPSVEPEPTVAAPTPAMEPVKDEGLFPTLKKKFLGFIGKEEPPAVSQPPIDVPEPMPAPATDVTTPDMSTSADVNGLPELPALDSTGASEPLPSLGAEAPAAPPTGNEALEIVRNQQVKESDGLPSLPEENEPASAVDMPELPDAAPPPPTVTTAIEPIIEQEVAALPPARQPAPASTDDQKGEKAVTVPFALSEMEVPIASQDALKELARQLTVDKNKIVTVVAYASAPPEQSSLARRVSLARALAVRAFLIDLGVDNIRINVQSLGNSFPEGTDQTERADIFLK